jgi:hypothetical protein
MRKIARDLKVGTSTVQRVRRSQGHDSEPLV